MKSILPHRAALALAAVPFSALTAGFEDTSSSPALDGATGLRYAAEAGGGPFYPGKVGDSRVVVVGARTGRRAAGAVELRGHPLVHRALGHRRVPDRPPHPGRVRG